MEIKLSAMDSWTSSNVECNMLDSELVGVQICYTEHIDSHLNRMDI